MLIAHQRPARSSDTRSVDQVLDDTDSVLAQLAHQLEQVRVALAQRTRPR